MRHLRNIYGPDLPAPLYKARARNVTQSSDWDWPTPYVAVICCAVGVVIVVLALDFVCVL